MTRMLVAFICLSLISCSGIFKRHHTYRSDFNPNSQEDSQRWYRSNAKLVDQSMVELGYTESRALAPNEREVLSNRLLLKKYESKIPTRLEREQYFKYKPYMRSDRDRIEFLGLKTYPEKEMWLERNGVKSSDRNYGSTISRAIESQDVVPHMPMDAVLKSWGEPDFREISGNPIYGNEKWRYVEYESTPAGFQKKEKVVYFEQGLVHAWQTK